MYSFGSLLRIEDRINTGAFRIFACANNKRVAYKCIVKREWSFCGEIEVSYGNISIESGGKGCYGHGWRSICKDNVLKAEREHFLGCQKISLGVGGIFCCDSEDRSRFAIVEKQEECEIVVEAIEEIAGKTEIEYGSEYEESDWRVGLIDYGEGHRTGHVRLFHGLSIFYKLLPKR